MWPAPPGDIPPTRCCRTQQVRIGSVRSLHRAEPRLRTAVLAGLCIPTRFTPAIGLRLADGPEDLDADVAFVRNRDGTARQGGHVAGLAERPIAAALAAPFGQEGPVGVEALDAVIEAIG